MKIGFLFGAGISLHAKFPSTKQITEKILTGRDVFRHTDSTYIIRPGFSINEGDLYTRFIPQIKSLLLIIHNEITDYHKTLAKSKLINYEDLYYVVDQLHKNEYEEIESVIVDSFKVRIFDQILPLLNIKSTFYNREIPAGELFSETKNYIRDIVLNMLDQNFNSGKLEFLIDSCSDESISKVHIFTLNHDTLLERFLSKSRITYIDGFKPPENGVRYWSPGLFGNSESNVPNIYKLHGSINWYRMRISGGTWYHESYGIPESVNYSTDPEGNELFAPDSRPLILVGSFNKVSEYIDGINIELFCQFYNKLKEIDLLIISGYSFGDKGINSRITNWVYQSMNKKILIIDPNLNILKSNARGSISGKWNTWTTDVVLKTIEDGIENIAWEQIKKLI